MNDINTTISQMDGMDDALKLIPFLKRQIRSSSLGIVYQIPHDGLRMNVTVGGNVAERLLVSSQL